MLLNNLTRRSFCGAIFGSAIASSLPPYAKASLQKGITHRVTIEQFKFTPASLKISVGDTVEWINHDTVPHTATEKENAWDTQNLDTGQTARIEFTSPGTFNYKCLYHPVMLGEISVIAS